MGPNLYVTPPGLYIKFHQDGAGTVDSGHLALAGFNEVSMVRRLPQGCDMKVINASRKEELYEMPHDYKEVRIFTFSIVCVLPS